MAVNSAALKVMGDAFAAAFPFMSLHTSGGIASSGSESSAPRKAAGWVVGADGKITASSVPFTGGAASGPCVRVGYWSAASGGTYGGGTLLAGDQSFNAAGEFLVPSLTETPTASWPHQYGGQHARR